MMKLVGMALHRCCTSVHFSIQPTCMPALDGEPSVPANCGRLVGRSVWYQISNGIQVRRFIHLGDEHSKQWAAICGIQVTIYSYLVTAGEDQLQPRDRLS